LNVRQPVGTAGPAPGAEQRAPNADEEEDIALVRCVAAGDHGALAALYRRHGRVVLAQIVLTVGETALAEEILQDTMLAVWRGAAAFRGESAVRSWIISIARRRLRDRLRRRSVEVVADMTELSGWPATEPGPEAAALERAEVTALAEAIKDLNRIHREVLGLVFGGGLSMAETAGLLEVPVGTVKSRLFAARAALARSLAEKGYDR
jgi:RNA polymerase sigma-70 factor (ECF subfamily)